MFTQKTNKMFAIGGICRSVCRIFALAIAVIGCATVKMPTIDSERLSSPGTYTYGHSAAQAFAEELSDSLSEPIPAVAVEAVVRRFVDLPRNEISRSDLFEIKFRYQHWRHAVYDRVINAALEAATPTALQEQIKVLIALSPSVQIHDLKTIYENALPWAESSEFRTMIESFVELVMRQGDTRITREVFNGQISSLDSEAASSNLDGPGKRIRIPPSYKSAWPFERWSKHEEFSLYARGPEGVVYRGIEFVPGDILIVNLQNPSEGLFTVVLEGRNYSPHMAIFVEVETEIGSFPAVYEIHQVGVRLVPLHIFLSDLVSSYVEVFRHKDAPSDWKDRLNTASLDILSNEQGFNLFADDEHRDGDHYLTCVTAVQHLVESSGVLPSYPAPNDVSPGTLVNMKPLGFEATEYHSPTDFLTWDQLALIGIIDNGGYTDDIARQLVNELLSERMDELPLRLDGGAYRIFRWASGLVLRQVPVAAPLLRATFGYSKENFPMGTKELLAFMELVQMDINKPVGNLKPVLNELLSEYTSTSSFSIHSLIEDPEMRKAVDDSMVPLDRWFSEAP